MKASELIIGSIYMSIKFNMPVYLTAEDIAQMVYDADGAEIEPERVVEPIELTEEWLLKFGFEKDNIKSVFIINCGEYEMEVVMNAFSGSLKNSPSWFVSIKTGHGSQPVTVVKKYVHQIQNLYYELKEEELAPFVSGVWKPVIN